MSQTADQVGAAAQRGAQPCGGPLSRRQRLVLQRLLRGLKESADGWVCARRLQHPAVGGNRWGARVHELRTRHGIGLDKQGCCECADCRYYHAQARSRGEQPTRMSAWRLTSRARAERLLGVTR